MKTNYNYISILLAVLCLAGCAHQNKTLEINYLIEGVLCKENISLSFIGESGNIVSPYIDSVAFARLDSVTFEDNHPDKMELFSKPVALDFTKKIKPYSPEYYAADVVFHVTEAIGQIQSPFDTLNL